MNLTRPYSTLLRLYPRDYRALFAAEMLTAFEEADRERRPSGAAVKIRFAVAELLGLVLGAWAEWTAKIAYSVYHTNSYVGCRGARDLRLMRPAGVSWESFYGVPPRWADTIDRAGDTRACVNAHQNFVSGSNLRRLVMFARGSSCRCTPGASARQPYMGSRD
jgi:hypothetical protein